MHSHRLTPPDDSCWKAQLEVKRIETMLLSQESVPGWCLRSIKFAMSELTTSHLQGWKRN